LGDRPVLLPEEEHPLVSGRLSLAMPTSAPLMKVLADRSAFCSMRNMRKPADHLSFSMIVLCGLSTRLFLADRGELLLEVLLAVCGELLFLEEVLLSTEMILVVVSLISVWMLLMCHLDGMFSVRLFDLENQGAFALAHPIKQRR
jgi:hypothetical protein